MLGWVFDLKLAVNSQEGVLPHDLNLLGMPWQCKPS